MAQLTVFALRKAATKTLNLYRKIANDRVYAMQVTRATRRSDLNALSKLFSQVVTPPFGEGSNTVGFQITFPAPLPAGTIENFIQASGVDVKLTSIGLRSASRLIIPLLAKISRCRKFAERLVLAARTGNNVKLRKLIAPFFPGNRFISVRGSKGEFVIQVRASNNVLFETGFFVSE